MILDSHYIGAASEMKAAEYFLRQGYQVWFPVVQQGSVDLIATQGSLVLKVQVKTATWNRSPSLTNEYLQCRVHPRSGQGDYGSKEFDVFFVVAPGGRMWEIPWQEIHEVTTNLCLDAQGPTVRDKKSSWAEWEVACQT